MKAKLKLFAIYILRMIMNILHIFPVKKGRIIFFSFHGKQYSCSPKYISEYLSENFPGQFEIIWAFREPEKFAFLKEKGIKTVKYASFMRLYYESTAQVSINNIGSFSWIPLRKNQLHINTWHGGGCYKKTSLGESRNSDIMNKTLLMTAQETSYMISSSRFSTEYVIPNDFGYKGDVLNIGLPRNDILINGDRNSVSEKVRKHFDIPPNEDIILYAPTWRYDNAEEIVMPDIEEVKKSYEKRFGKKCVFIFRAHSWMLCKASSENFIDGSDYPDMQELLLTCDMLLSDYSSCIWDYSLTYRPCLLFTPDLDKYVEERGFDIDIMRWGFPVCRTMKELNEQICNFDMDDFRAKMKKHQEDLGNYDTGVSCEKLGKLLYDFCFDVAE